MEVCGERILYVFACVERRARERRGVALLLCGCAGECVMAREHSSLYASCERHEHPAEKGCRGACLLSLWHVGAKTS